MMRILTIIATSAFGLVAIALLAFTSPVGRRMLADIFEARLAAATGGAVEIGSLSGAPPTLIVLSDVALKDERGLWLAVDEIRFVWRPLALFGRGVDIESLTIDGARLERRPAATSQNAPFTLPKRLPRIAIERLAIRSMVIGAGLTGREIALNGAGRFTMGGAALRADFSLDGAASGDKAAAQVVIDPNGDAVRIRIDLASPADGAIAAVAGFGGAISIKASGDGPPDNFRIETTAALGALAEIKAAFSGDIKKSEAIDAAGALQLGARLSPLAREIGSELAFDFSIRKAQNGYAADIRRLSSGVGTAAGTIAAKTDTGGAISQASAAIRVSLATNYRPSVQALLGGDAKIEATAERRGGKYAFSGTVLAPRATLRFVDAARRSDGVTALVDLAVSPNTAGPAFARAGFDARGRLVRETGGRYSFEDAMIHTARIGAFAGRGGYAPAAGLFDLEGDVRFAPEAVSRFAPWAHLGGRTAGKIAARGALSNFTTQINLRATQGETPVQLVAEIAGLPDSPRGRIAYEGRRGVSAIATLDTPSPGELRLRTITARGAAFSLDGQAAFGAQDRALTLDLHYEAAAATELWPGVSVEGAGALKGVIALGQNKTALAGDADRLTINGARIDGLVASATGASSALQLMGKVRAAVISGSPPLRGARLEAEVDLKTRAATVKSMSASLNGADLRLARPARLRFDNGIAVEGATLSVGAKGFVSFDAAATSRRWAAKAHGENLPLSDAGAATAEFAFDLDTDRRKPGAGTFRVAASAADGAPFEIGAAAHWDGRRLHIEDSGSNAAFDLSLDAPAVLRRADRLSLDRSGAMRGAARFVGPVEAIADFLPAALQTLEGTLDVTATLSGTSKTPVLTGAMALKDGSYTELVSGLTLVNLAGEARAEPAPGGSILHVRATGRGADEKRDSLSFEGRALLGVAPSFDGGLAFADSVLAADDVERAVVNGTARLSGPLSRLTLGGDLEVKALDYRLKARKASSLRSIEIRAVGADAPARETDAAPRPRIVFDLRLAADNDLGIIGRGLASVWKAKLALTGLSDEPALTGRLDLQRGAIDFSGRRFAMTRGTVIFDRLSRNDPALDMRAERLARDGTLAVITVKGRASAPELALTSVPATPQEDVTALVLFGKRAVELTAIESLQAAQALAQLSGLGGGASRALGLDLLNVDFDTDTGAGAIAVGKTVARGLFVSARQDIRGENGSVRAEYGVTDTFSIETELKQSGDQTISVNWKKDF